MRKALLLPLLLIFAGSVQASDTVTCKKSYFDFSFSNAYLGSLLPEASFELGDPLAAEYVIEYDSADKKIHKITVNHKAPQVKLVFNRDNSEITHSLKKLEEIDEEFCADNPCRDNYEYIHAEMKTDDLGAVATVTIEIDNVVVYPDMVSSSSEIRVGSFTLSSEADATSCGGTILLERMNTSNQLEADLLE